MKKLLVAFIVLFSLILTGCEATPTDVVQESAKEALTEYWEWWDNTRKVIPIEEYITSEEIENSDDLNNLFQGKYAECVLYDLACGLYKTKEYAYGVSIANHFKLRNFQSFEYLSIQGTDYLRVEVQFTDVYLSVYINQDNIEEYCYKNIEYYYLNKFYFKYDDASIIKDLDSEYGGWYQASMYVIIKEDGYNENLKSTVKSLVCKPLKSS